MEALLAILTIVATVLPAIVAMWNKEVKQDETLSSHSVDELRIGTDIVRKPPAV